MAFTPSPAVISFQERHAVKKTSVQPRPPATKEGVTLASLLASISSATANDDSRVKRQCLRESRKTIPMVGPSPISSLPSQGVSHHVSQDLVDTETKAKLIERIAWRRPPEAVLSEETLETRPDVETIETRTQQERLQGQPETVFDNGSPIPDCPRDDNIQFSAPSSVQAAPQVIPWVIPSSQDNTGEAALY